MPARFSYHQASCHLYNSPVTWTPGPSGLSRSRIFGRNLRVDERTPSEKTWWVEEKRRRKPREMLWKRRRHSDPVEDRSFCFVSGWLVHNDHPSSQLASPPEKKNIHKKQKHHQSLRWLPCPARWAIEWLLVWAGNSVHKQYVNGCLSTRTDTLVDIVCMMLHVFLFCLFSVCWAICGFNIFNYLRRYCIQTDDVFVVKHWESGLWAPMSRLALTCESRFLGVKMEVAICWYSCLLDLMYSYFIKV